MPRRKDPSIPDALLDRLLAGGDPGQGRVDAVPAALQPRPQPHRDGFLQAQILPARESSANH